MALTKEQIELLKENPFAQLLFSIFDDLEVEQHDQKAEIKPKTEVKQKAAFKISKKDYEYIKEAAINFNRCLITARQIGLVPNIKDLTLVGGLITIIYSLLRIYVGQDFANKFINGLCSDRLTPEYFNELYNDQIRNN